MSEMDPRRPPRTSSIAIDLAGQVPSTPTKRARILPAAPATPTTPATPRGSGTGVRVAGVRTSDGGAAPTPGRREGAAEGRPAGTRDSKDAEGVMNMALEVLMSMQHPSERTTPPTPPRKDASLPPTTHRALRSLDPKQPATFIGTREEENDAGLPYLRASSIPSNPHPRPPRPPAPPERILSKPRSTPSLRDASQQQAPPVRPSSPRRPHPHARQPVSSAPRAPHSRQVSQPVATSSLSRVLPALPPAPSAPAPISPAPTAFPSIPSAPITLPPSLPPAPPAAPSADPTTPAPSAAGTGPSGLRKVAAKSKSFASLRAQALISTVREELKVGITGSSTAAKSPPSRPAPAPATLQDLRPGGASQLRPAGLGEQLCFATAAQSVVVVGAPAPPSKGQLGLPAPPAAAPAPSLDQSKPVPPTRPKAAFVPAGGDGTPVAPAGTDPGATGLVSQNGSGDGRTGGEGSAPVQDYVRPSTEPDPAISSHRLPKPPSSSAARTVGAGAKGSAPDETKEPAVGAPFPVVDPGVSRTGAGSEALGRGTKRSSEAAAASTTPTRDDEKDHHVEVLSSFAFPSRPISSSASSSSEVPSSPPRSRTQSMSRQSSSRSRNHPHSRAPSTASSSSLSEHPRHSHLVNGGRPPALILAPGKHARGRSGSSRPSTPTTGTALTTPSTGGGFSSAGCGSEGMVTSAPPSHGHGGGGGSWDAGRPVWFNIPSQPPPYMSHFTPKAVSNVNDDSTPKPPKGVPALQAALPIRATRLPPLPAHPPPATTPLKDGRKQMTTRQRARSFGASIAAPFTKASHKSSPSLPPPVPSMPMPHVPPSTTTTAKQAGGSEAGMSTFATLKGRLRGKSHASAGSEDQQLARAATRPEEGQQRQSSAWSSDDEVRPGRRKKNFSVSATAPAGVTTPPRGSGAGPVTPASAPSMSPLRWGRKHRSKTESASGSVGGFGVKPSGEVAARGGVQAPPLTPSASASTSSLSHPSTPPQSRPQSRTSARHPSQDIRSVRSRPSFDFLPRSGRPSISTEAGSVRPSIDAGTRSRSRSRSRPQKAAAIAEYQSKYLPELEEVYAELSRATARDAGGRYAGIGMADGLWGTPTMTGRTMAGGEGMGGGVGADEMGVVRHTRSASGLVGAFEREERTIRASGRVSGLGEAPARLSELRMGSPISSGH